MIKFIEKEHTDGSTWTTKRIHAPVYMVKDGKEFFVCNRVVSSQSFVCVPSGRDYDAIRSAEKMEEYKNFLLSHDGKYVKFSGSVDDILALLQDMKESGDSFKNVDETMFYLETMFRRESESEESADLIGRRVQTGDGFFYRIYDKELLEAVRKSVNEIVKRKGE